MISVRTLCKGFGDRRVLAEVSAEVAPGEIVAIVGPSGGGKSTLLRCLNHLEPFDTGAIDIAGFSLAPGPRGADAATLRRLRTKVGMVFQQWNLFPHLTALANVTLAPRIVHRVDAAAVAERGRALLTRVGLGERADAFPHELSGGQQQRVAIARALAQQPEVLLFDEPTSALDPEMTDEVIAVMRDVAAGGMTMLIVTHEMRLAAELATRIWVLDRGTLVEDGPARQVVEAPTSAVAREYFRGRR